MSDIFLFQKLNSLAFHSVLLDAFFIFCAHYLPIMLIIALFLFSILFFFFGKHFFIRPKTLFLALLSGGLAYFIAQIIRFFWFKPRPFLVLKTPLLLSDFPGQKSAFPSGHASFFFATSYMLYHFHKKLGIVFLLFSILLTISRVIAGVHWPFDIVAGAFLGLLSAVIVFFLQRIFQKFFLNSGKSSQQ